MQNPEHELMTSVETRKAVHCGKTAFHNYRNDPSLNFPRPIVMGRGGNLRWLRAEVMAWIDSRPRR